MLKFQFSTKFQILDVRQNFSLKVPVTRIIMSNKFCYMVVYVNKGTICYFSLPDRENFNHEQLFWNQQYISIYKLNTKRQKHLSIHLCTSDHLGFIINYTYIYIKAEYGNILAAIGIVWKYTNISREIGLQQNSHLPNKVFRVVYYIPRIIIITCNYTKHE